MKILDPPLMLNLVEICAVVLFDICENPWERGLMAVPLTVRDIASHENEEKWYDNINIILFFASSRIRLCISRPLKCRAPARAVGVATWWVAGELF